METGKKSEKKKGQKEEMTAIRKLHTITMPAGRVSICALCSNSFEKKSQNRATEY